MLAPTVGGQAQKLRIDSFKLRCCDVSAKPRTTATTSSWAANADCATTAPSKTPLLRQNGVSIEELRIAPPSRAQMKDAQPEADKQTRQPRAIMLDVMITRRYA